MNAGHLLIVLKMTPEYTSLNAVYLLAVPEESLQSGTTKLLAISVLARPLASATPSRLWIPRAQRPKSEPGYVESGVRELGCSSTSGQIVTENELREIHDGRREQMKQLFVFLAPPKQQQTAMSCWFSRLWIIGIRFRVFYPL